MPEHQAAEASRGLERSRRNLRLLGSRPSSNADSWFRGNGTDRLVCSLETKLESGLRLDWDGMTADGEPWTTPRCKAINPVALFSQHITLLGGRAALARAGISYRRDAFPGLCLRCQVDKLVGMGGG